MTAKPSLFPSLGRLLVYAVLALATAFFLLPLYAMLVTSFKDAEEIRSTSLLALPAALNGAAWGTAWSSACTGVDCNGLRPFFWNSVAMAVPAVMISTVWGALNGYVLSLWKFRGSDALFGTSARSPLWRGASVSAHRSTPIRRWCWGRTKCA